MCLVLAPSPAPFVWCNKQQYYNKLSMALIRVTHCVIPFMPAHMHRSIPSATILNVYASLESVPTRSPCLLAYEHTAIKLCLNFHFCTI